MISSNKKKRGQQRKAEKANKESVVMKLHQELVAFTKRGIRKADNKATLGLIDPTKILSTNTNEDFRGSKADIIIEVLPTVLNFLKRCEDETYDQVLRSVRGDLRTPSVWIEVLLNGAVDVASCRLQITENIGPLVRCMCNDTERLFFKSNKHWNESIVSFVQLITTITCHSINDKEEILTDKIFKYDGLLSSVVQWAFWGMRERPDIARDLQSEEISHIRMLGRKTTEMIVCSDNYVRDEMGLLTEKGKSVLDIVAATPFVSKEFDPTCMVSFVAGYIRQLKNDRMKLQDESFLVLKRLIGEASCVDKGVVSELIDLGLNYVADNQSAFFVADISHDMLLERDILVSDTRVAFAIRSGIVEMCLGFIERFGIDDASLYGCIYDTLKCIYSISLHTKSAKAIRSKRRDIEEKLDSTIMNNTKSKIEKLLRLKEDKGDPSLVHTMLNMRNNNVTCASHPKIKKLVEMVGCILDINGSYCCRCNKSLSKTEVMECNGCSSMVYCSKACQKDDWLNGHSLTCSKSYALELAGQFQGRILAITTQDNERDATKLDELEKNMTMIQLKLFIDNSETILGKAKSLDIPLYDCIVVFDLRKCPPVVTTESYIEWFDTPVVTKCFEETRSKENITCMYTSFFYNNGDLCPSGRAPNVTMQRMFPHTWLKNSFDHRSQPIAESTSSSCAQTEQYCELHISHRMNDEEVSILTESVFEEEVPDESPSSTS